MKVIISGSSASNSSGLYERDQWSKYNGQSIWNKYDGDQRFAYKRNDGKWCFEDMSNKPADGVRTGSMQGNFFCSQNTADNFEDATWSDKTVSFAENNEITNYDVRLYDIPSSGKRVFGDYAHWTVQLPAAY